MSISTLSPFLQQVLLDSGGFGLDGSGAPIEDVGGLIENLYKICRDFSVQTDEPGFRHLNALLTTRGVDYDKTLLEAFLTRAPLRIVDVADVARVVSGEARFSEPPPFAALTTDERELDFPSVYEGTYITALSAFYRSSWWEEAVDSRNQPANRYLRDDVWEKIFRNFVFSPRVYFCDPYILDELERKVAEGKSAATESSFGYFVSKLIHLHGTSTPAEQQRRPRSLHILSSAPTHYSPAKRYKNDFVRILKKTLDELAPPFDVEFIITDSKFPGSKKSILHDRFCAAGTTNGNIVRVIGFTTSMNSYLSKKISSDLTQFTLQTNSVKAGVYGSYWAKTTSDWRSRGFEYRWSSKNSQAPQRP